MKKIKTTNMLFVIVALGMFVLVGCGGTDSTSSTQTTNATATPALTQATPASTQAGAISTEQPVPAVSSSQAGSSDIPDSLVFVTYVSSPGKYQFDAPEGWAQTANATDVSFTSNLNALQVHLKKAPAQPTTASVRTDQAAMLQQTGRAVRDVKIQDVQLPSGPAVLISFTSNSDPNSVTGKQVRLENNMYLFYKNGMLATLTLSAPAGADNVDQWARISRSFKWV